MRPVDRLVAAALLGQVTEVRRMVAADPALLSARNMFGLVRLLLERGADVNGRRGDGMTALHSACWRGLGRVAQELLDAGADPAITAVAGPHRGQTPADTALAQGHLLLAARLDVPGQSVSSPYG
ncbi:ankyrin repeat domain-containing protein [Trebonia sp.]|uniref:ankyrin repeat domain-containing protein n=1 Tax=Trebonia sp. TaxID=2767075 RepID=UPI0026363A24|nr:ankyrin repeat domain-containing protein [Trebonia sp.]